jgi:hypothetical protein
MSDTWITALVPSAASGTVSVTVTTAGGTTSGIGYTYSAPAGPAVTARTPTTGLTTGGDTVTVLGSGFTAATAVTFGSTAALSFQVLSDSALLAVVPAGSAGTVHITVTTAGGTSSTSTSDQYTYTAASAPTVTGLGTTSGSGSGGTTVILTGTHLGAASQVLFGGIPATTFVVNSDTQVTAIAPAHASGTVDVTVTTAVGTSSTSSSDHFTYSSVPVPTVTMVGPTAGPTAGGNAVLVSGSRFLGATSVAFGTAAATSFTVLSDTELFAVAPAGTGTVDVTVTTPAGTSATASADDYSYQSAPTISAISPGSEVVSGGMLVTLTGTNLLGTTGVYFGDAPAANVLVVSSTSVVAMVPAHAAGSVDVTVVAPGGFSGTVSFTYTSSTTITWIGGTGGWATASNWDSSTVPGTGNDVIIPTGSTVSYTGVSGSAITVHGLTLAGSLELGANLTVSGAIQVNAGSLTIDTSKTLYAGNYGQAGGSVYSTGAINVTGSMRLGGGSLDEESGGSSGLTLGAFLQTGGSFTLDNTGFTVGHDFQLAGGTGLISSGSGTISGRMLLTGGTQTLHDLGTITVTGGVQVTEGGTLLLQGGQLTANLTNAGTLSLGSRTSPVAGDSYTINGNFTQTSGASLFMDMGASATDSLTVTGTAALDGLFALNLTGGYVPSASATFPMLTYGSRVGGFSALSLPVVTSGSWDFLYDDSSSTEAFKLLFAHFGGD